MLVHHLRRRPNFKTTMIQRLQGSYVMAGVFSFDDIRKLFLKLANRIPKT